MMGWRGRGYSLDWVVGKASLVTASFPEVQGFSESGPRTRSIGITWKYSQKVGSWAAPDLLNRRLWGRGQRSVFTCPPGIAVRAQVENH